MSASDDFRLSSGGTVRINFQWAEPRFGVTQDFDIGLINTATNTVVASSVDENPASGFPFEFVTYTNNTASPQNLAFVIQRFSGTQTPRFKIIFIRPSAVSNVEYATPNAPGDTVGATIFGHNGAASEIVTAATPFNDGVNAESYSSRGPVTYLFGPVNGTTPASPITPVTVQPTITATDGGANTFFGELIGGTWRFFGTSQSAPHVAGVLALMRQKAPSAGPDQLEGALTSTASAMNGGVAVVGAGRVNALGAIGAPGSPPPPPPPPPSSCMSSRIGRTVAQVNSGRLQVNLTTTAGSFTSISTTGLTNATLEVNGSPLAVGQSAALSGGTATVFVQRVGGGGSFIARFNVVDACGSYPLFFGKGS